MKIWCIHKADQQPILFIQSWCTLKQKYSGLNINSYQQYIVTDSEPLFNSNLLLLLLSLGLLVLQILQFSQFRFFTEWAIYIIHTIFTSFIHPFDPKFGSLLSSDSGDWMKICTYLDWPEWSSAESRWASWVRVLHLLTVKASSCLF